MNQISQYDVERTIELIKLAEENLLPKNPHTFDIGLGYINDALDEYVRKPTFNAALDSIKSIIETELELHSDLDRYEMDRWRAILRYIELERKRANKYYSKKI